MAVLIGTNVSSLTAQRHLANATSALSVTSERLASGQRINRPSDDAAGIAVADTLRVKSRLHTTAIRNINDGVSALNVIGSALDEQKKVLMRLTELAEQSANGVYSGEQRDAMNREYQELVKEFGRIGETTSFNGVSLLQAGRGENPSQILIQAGVDAAEASALLLPLIDSSPMSGRVAVYGDIDSDGVITGGGDWVTYVRPVVLNRVDFITGEVLPNITMDSLSVIGGSSLFRTTVVDDQGKKREIAYNCLEAAASPGWLLAFEYLGNGRLDLIADVSLSPISTSATASLSFSDGATGNLNVDLSALTFVNGDEGHNEWYDPYQTGEPTHVIVHDATALTNPDCIDATGVETVGRARAALETVKNRINKLSEAQGLYGALQSRLQSALSTLATSRENAIAAESRIRNADVAQEAAQLVRTQILQQASASVLSQANQAPTLALTLLQ